MKIFESAAEAGRALDRPWLTIGNFDGLHVGHRAVVARCVSRARESGASALAMTFRPHPAAVLTSRGAPPRLVSDAQQEELLASVGIDALLRQRFDETFASARARDFHDDFLVSLLCVRGMVVGSTFRFGAGREGDVSSLREWGSLEIEDVAPVVMDGDVVSSSRVRRLVAEGALAQARRLLGRPHVLEGVVTRGEHRGRTIGFPTANVAVIDQVVPATGVYACVLRAGERYLPAVTNVGRRPTFGGGDVLVETHALVDPGDLYDLRVRVAFTERIRDEAKFSGIGELSAQIARDVEAARAVHVREPPGSLAGPAF